MKQMVFQSNINLYNVKYEYILNLFTSPNITKAYIDQYFVKTSPYVSKHLDP